MSEDEGEDWFERAMRETEDEEGSDTPRATADEGSEDAEMDDDEQDPFGGIAATEEDELSDEEGDPFGGTEVEEELFGGSPEAEMEDGSPDEGSGDVQQDPTDDGESDPFGGGGAAEGLDGDGESDPFGGGGATEGLDGDGESDPFGGGGAAGGLDGDGESDPFEGDEGFGGGGGGAPDFDEAELDSDIDRIDVGVEGLDEMILGGIPERSLMVVIGSAGTGKTTFALQFLLEALENDEKAVYITLEESRDAILSTAEEKGWPFRTWNDEGKLAVVSMDPIEMANSLSSIRNDISRLVEEFGADRLVLDSVSLLEMMYDHPAKRRSEVFDFARSLKRAGVTTMLTSEANSENSYNSRYGIIEYLVDAVFVLQYVRQSDFQETRMAIGIQKIRDANHSRETKPYDITNEGISVYRQANIF